MKKLFRESLELSLIIPVLKNKISINWLKRIENETRSHAMLALDKPLYIKYNQLCFDSL